MNGKKTDATSGYDGELQMFCETAREPSRDALIFLRWLAEQGRLEHEVSGPASGELADQLVAELAGQAA